MKSFELLSELTVKNMFGSLSVYFGNCQYPQKILEGNWNVRNIPCIFDHFISQFSPICNHSLLQQLLSEKMTHYCPLDANFHMVNILTNLILQLMEKRRFRVIKVIEIRQKQAAYVDLTQSALLAKNTLNNIINLQAPQAPPCLGLHKYRPNLPVVIN